MQNQSLSDQLLNLYFQGAFWLGLGPFFQLCGILRILVGGKPLQTADKCMHFILLIRKKILQSSFMVGSFQRFLFTVYIPVHQSTPYPRPQNCSTVRSCCAMSLFPAFCQMAPYPILSHSYAAHKQQSALNPLTVQTQEPTEGTVHKICHFEWGLQFGAIFFW